MLKHPNASHGLYFDDVVDAQFGKDAFQLHMSTPVDDYDPPLKKKRIRTGALRPGKVWEMTTTSSAVLTRRLLYTEENPFFWVDVSRRFDGLYVTSSSRFESVVLRKKDDEDELTIMSNENDPKSVFEPITSTTRWKIVSDLRNGKEWTVHLCVDGVDDDRLIALPNNVHVCNLSVFDDRTVFALRCVHTGAPRVGVALHEHLDALERIELLDDSLVHARHKGDLVVTSKTNVFGSSPLAFPTLYEMTTSKIVPTEIEEKQSDVNCRVEQLGDVSCIVSSSYPPEEEPDLIYVRTYGCYGHFLQTDYDAQLVETLRVHASKVKVVDAFVRGGGERGNAFQASGMQTGKDNAIDDVVAVAKALKTTHPSAKLVCESRSAGATLLPLAADSSPSLFDGIVLNVPFLDVRASLKDESSYLYRSELEEYGDVRRSGALDAFERLDPTAAAEIRGHVGPHALITCGSEDERTPLGGTLKYVFSTRRAQVWNEDFSKLVVLNVVAGEGHFADTTPRIRSAFFDHVLADAVE